jgi:nucleoid DNA-binding protein
LPGTLRANMRQQRKCLTLVPKPSLIDGIPLHGGGRRVNKSGLIDAIGNATSMTTSEIGNSVHAPSGAVVSNVSADRRLSAVGLGCVNPTQRGSQEIRQQVDHEDSSKGTGVRNRPAAGRRDRQARSGRNWPSGAFG